MIGTTILYEEEGKTNINEEWIKLFTDDELDQYWWPNIDQYDEVKKLFGDLLIKLSDKKDNPREDWNLTLFHTPMVEYNLFKSLLVLWDILLQR